MPDNQSESCSCPTGLNITGSASAVLRLGEVEGSYVDIEGTGFRVIREDGQINLVEIGGSGGRVIARGQLTRRGRHD